MNKLDAATKQLKKNDTTSGIRVVKSSKLASKRKTIDLDLLPSKDSIGDTSALLIDEDIKPFQSFVPSTNTKEAQTDFSFKMPGGDHSYQECLTAGCYLKQTMEAASHTLTPQAFIQNPPEIRWKITY